MACPRSFPGLASPILSFPQPLGSASVSPSPTNESRNRSFPNLLRSCRGRKSSKAMAPLGSSLPPQPRLRGGREGIAMLKNRTNLTLSANTFGLNLVTRTFARNAGLNTVGATLSLRVRHSHHERMADVMRVDVAKDARKYRTISKSPISIWNGISSSPPTIDSSLPVGTRCSLTPSLTAWSRPAQGQWSAIQPLSSQPTVSPGGSFGSWTNQSYATVSRPIVRAERVMAVRGSELARASAEG